MRKNNWIGISSVSEKTVRANTKAEIAGFKNIT